MFKVKNLQELALKFTAGTFLAAIGLVFGWLGGGIFETIGVFAAAELPWQESIAFLVAVAGFFLGFSVDLE